jgi:hypothetical protein
MVYLEGIYPILRNFNNNGADRGRVGPSETPYRTKCAAFWPSAAIIVVKISNNLNNLLCDLSKII